VKEVHNLKPFDSLSLAPMGHDPGKNRLWISIKDRVCEVFGGKIIEVNGVPTYNLQVNLQGIYSALGKLGLKNEPAGKVRVFAMVDPITQWMLRPLHKCIFSFLRKIPMDGTFDQIKPLVRLLSMNPKSLHSFDLTAATDRLPLILQEQLMAQLIGKEMAKHWSNLLVSRPYLLKGKPLYYGAGQPMGALSSWAMLA
jgi:hypothetical protein